MSDQNAYKWSLFRTFGSVMCHIFTDTFGKATPNKFLIQILKKKKIGGREFCSFFIFLLFRLL